MSGSSAFSKLFSGGLGKGGQLGAWAVAFGVVGAWQYYENRKNGEAFTKEEQSKWNEEKKKSAKKS